MRGDQANRQNDAEQTHGVQDWEALEDAKRAESGVARSEEQIARDTADRQVEEGRSVGGGVLTKGTGAVNQAGEVAKGVEKTANGLSRAWKAIRNFGK